MTVGWDASTGGLAAIKEGRLSATFDAHPRQQASEALTILVDCIKNKKTPEKAAIYIAPTLVAR